MKKITYLEESVLTILNLVTFVIHGRAEKYRELLH